MQRDGGADDAGPVQAVEQAGREMQPGGGGGDGAFAGGVDGLVVAAVHWLRAGRAGYVRRQGQGAGTVEGVGETGAFLVEAQRDAAIRVAAGDAGGQVFGAFEGEPVPVMQPAGVAGQRVPGAVRQGAVQGDADARGAAAGGELGRDDPRVVGDEDVAAAEQAGQVADDAVVQPGLSHVQQPGRVAWAGRVVGDAVRRELEGEVACFPSRQNGRRFPPGCRPGHGNRPAEVIGPKAGRPLAAGPSVTVTPHVVADAAPRPAGRWR